jgi:hypothetical protein
VHRASAKAPGAMRNGTESGLQAHPPFSIFDPLHSILPVTLLTRNNILVRFAFNLLCPILFSVALGGCGSSRSEHFYPTIAEAEKAGEATRGWIPDDLVSPTAENIHLVEGLSPSREWCSFEFRPSDSQSFTTKMAKISSLPSAVRRIANPRVSWWPEELTGDLDVNKLRGDGFELYTVERHVNSVNVGIYLFAVDPQKGRGFFYWSYE